ncbi:MAG TPA: L-dopachrome tautomerase-related protein [Povalibacter sp.]|nr:L-dopachrome tautomerase-related protein [Povalibacter sp.]
MRPKLMLLAAITLAPLCVGAQELAREKTIGNLEVVATFDGPMPTGVAVSNDGRVFVNFPRWGDEKSHPDFFTVGEVKNGRTVPYPSAEMNKGDPNRAAQTLLAAQSVVVDPTGKRLWIVDTGNGFGDLREGGPKLVAVDLDSNEVVKTIPIALSVAVPGTYLNDVRFDLERGPQGTAFITDSGTTGIIIVDIASGKSWRRLQNHATTRPEPAYMPVYEGQVLYRDGQRFQIGSDGIALSPDAKWLYYSVLSGRHLFRVSVDALADPRRSDAEIAKTIEDLGEKGGSADGLEADAEGRIYITDFENNSIHRRKVDGTLETLVSDPRLLWPDTLALAANGFMYVTANQIGRQARFQGKDLRQKPYVVFRFKVDGKRIGQ